jgi:hypothetical protein
VEIDVACQIEANTTRRRNEDGQVNDRHRPAPVSRASPIWASTKRAVWGPRLALSQSTLRFTTGESQQLRGIRSLPGLCCQANGCIRARRRVGSNDHQREDGSRRLGAWSRY